MGNPILIRYLRCWINTVLWLQCTLTSPPVIPEVNEGLPIPLFEFFVDSSRAILNMVYRNIFKRFPNIRFVMPHAGGFSTMTERLSSVQALHSDIEGNMKRMFRPGRISGACSVACTFGDCRSETTRLRHRFSLSFTGRCIKSWKQTGQYTASHRRRKANDIYRKR